MHSSAHKWTEEEIEVLKSSIPGVIYKEVAFKLGLTLSQVKRKAKMLGIKSDDNGRFKKGHISPYKVPKGVHLSPATEFKKGNVPGNLKYDGCIAKRYHSRDRRYYLYIRISKANWVLLNRHIWTQAHGPIPAKHTVRFKDGNCMNCKLDNLELISQAENMRRNHNYELTDKKVLAYLSRGLSSENKLKLASEKEELIKIKRLQIMLKKEIKKNDTVR